MDYGEAHALEDSLRCFKGHKEVCCAVCMRYLASSNLSCVCARALVVCQASLFSHCTPRKKMEINNTKARARYIRHAVL